MVKIMCGIIGYTGSDFATEKVLTGLEILEYRGYDSVGICTKSQGNISVKKVKGRVEALREKIKDESPVDSFCAIGHTRWATHGAPSDVNAHPHKVGRTCLVHNGIIENYKELKKELEGEGICFLSETDTEVACGVINSFFEKDNDPYRAIMQGAERLSGSYALAIVFEKEEDNIYAIRQGSPLIVAKGEDGFYLASDMTALLPFTNDYYALQEGEILKLTKDEAYIYGKGEPVFSKTNMSFEMAKKGGYEHFMLKEMLEQPFAIKNSLSTRIKDGIPCFLPDGIDDSFFKEITEIHIVACGSAMHAGILAGGIIEKIAKVPTRAYIASEYRYKPPVAREGTLVIVVSQSGETADSIASLRYAKNVGLRTLGIVNAVETTIAKEADFCAYTYAGPEIAVATTKGYTTQLSLMYLFAIALGLSKKQIEENEAKYLTECLFLDAPRISKAVLDRRNEIKKIAEAIYRREDIFYIGRGDDYALSLEASLKLKEISYIHCEAYASGELKHGTISLIEEGTPVIAIGTETELFSKLDSNIKEVKSRGALTILICSDMNDGEKNADMVFKLPQGKRETQIFGALMAVQMIAYEVSRMRGCDIDKPRNLAKSVTVE